MSRTKALKPLVQLLKKEKKKSNADLIKELSNMKDINERKYYLIDPHEERRMLMQSLKQTKEAQEVIQEA